MIGPEFPEYATEYSKNARTQRRRLPAPLREMLMDIEDELAENPDKYPRRTIPLDDDMFIYRHPGPTLEVTCKINRERKVISILHLVAPMQEVTKSVFISYSHEDEEWLLELKKWLKPLDQQDLIQIWDDSQIEAGDDWKQKIEEALADAKAAILLISIDFLTSEFITNNELPQLLERAEREGLTIFWIAVRQNPVEENYPEISRYQAVHKEPPLAELEPAKREKHYKRICQKIKEAVEA